MAPDMQAASRLYHPHRYWQTTPSQLPRVDEADAHADREDSMSERNAFLLGMDLGVCRLLTPLEWPAEAMARGHREGIKRQAQHADAYQRKLLRLRVNAFARGLPVSAAITSDFLRSIAVPVCPVSGAVLTRSTRLPTDWSIERLENSLGYVPGNVCVVSSRVNDLKAAATHEELLGHVAWMVGQHGAKGLEYDAGNGLTALEALRFAALASGPSGWPSGKVGRLPPLAMAPAVWGTPITNLAIVHVGCAQARIEDTSHLMRARWLKQLGKDVWQVSNRLVQRLATAVRAGEHPCDLWLEPEMAMPLKDLLQAMLEGRAQSATDGSKAIAAIHAAIAPIRQYRRIVEAD